MKVLDLVTGPAHALTDEQFKKEVGYPFPRGKASDAGQVVKRKPEVARQEPRQLHPYLWMPFIEMRGCYLIGRNDNVCERLHPVGGDCILNGMKSENCARKSEA